jgi:ElaB/YqjD/DUF883 family membrane-anchored ribosome-binding protein
MAGTRTLQKEIDALKKEIATLRASQARVRRKAGSAAEAAVEEGVDRLGALRDDIAERVGGIKDSIAGGASDVVDEIAEQLEELRATINSYSDQAEKTVTAHPFAAIAGAVAIGYLIGRLTR